MDDSRTDRRERRLAAVREAMAAQALDRLLVTSREHVRWISGFSGSSGWLLVGDDGDRRLLTDFRYREQAAEQAPGWTVEMAQAGLVARMRELAGQSEGTRIGFEGAHLTYREFRSLSEPTEKEPAPPVTWAATEQLVEPLLMRKDDEEIASIARAAAITDAALAEVLALVRPGAVERDIAAEIEYRMRRHGADGVAFEPIVASGPRAALPHARASDRRIEAGDMVTFDIGALVDGYRSDMTRTVAVAHASDRLREIYGIVLEAQVAALDAVRPGMTGITLDGIARKIIADRGYGEMFGHSLGHGVGLRIHEGPSVSWRSVDTLAAGMVVTVEPGIYLPGWGGVRIEDLVVVTDDGRRVLTGSPKELLVV